QRHRRLAEQLPHRVQRQLYHDGSPRELRLHRQRLQRPVLRDTDRDKAAGLTPYPINSHPQGGRPMVFSTPVFLFYFLVLTLLVYYLVPRKLRNVVILISSLVFYYWGEQTYVVIMFLSTAID